MFGGKGLCNVGRVEIKAETTCPNVNNSDPNQPPNQRTNLPKLEYTVYENGTFIRGSNYDINYSILRFQNRALIHRQQQQQQQQQQQNISASCSSTSAGSNHQKKIQVPRYEDFIREETERQQRIKEVPEDYLNQKNEYQFLPQSLPSSGGNKSTELDASEFVLSDSRASTVAIKCVNKDSSSVSSSSNSKYYCGASLERFSGHTGVCRVLGSKKISGSSHTLELGQFLRFGSVGLVVVEINSTTFEHTQETLTDAELKKLKEKYLALPLQYVPGQGNSTTTNNSSGSNNRSAFNAFQQQMRNRFGDSPSSINEEEVNGELLEEEKVDSKQRLRQKDPSLNVLIEDDYESQFDTSDDEDEDLQEPAKKPLCYICYDDDEEMDEKGKQSNPLVAPCACKGDTKYVHLNCLQRWNNNEDADGQNPNQKVCAVTNINGLDICSICKSTYQTSVRLADGRVISLLAKKLPPPYVTFAVVTQHETRTRSTALTNTRFQLSFASLLGRHNAYLSIGRSTSNNMMLRYRTVSQLHAKVKFSQNSFQLMDCNSSNGTMLFLSKPLELDWGKTYHIKVGRTILSMKAKKKWKWKSLSNFASSDPNDVSNYQQKKGASNNEYEGEADDINSGCSGNSTGRKFKNLFSSKKGHASSREGQQNHVNDKKKIGSNSNLAQNIRDNLIVKDLSTDTILNGISSGVLAVTEVDDVFTRVALRHFQEMQLEQENERIRVQNQH